MIEAASKALEAAEVQFSTVEHLYFAGKVDATALRSAWLEREAARKALATAHQATPRRANEVQRDSGN